MTNSRVGRRCNSSSYQLGENKVFHLFSPLFSFFFTFVRSFDREVDGVQFRSCSVFRLPRVYFRLPMKKRRISFRFVRHEEKVLLLSPSPPSQPVLICMKLTSHILLLSSSDVLSPLHIPHRVFEEVKEVKERD